MVNRDSVVRNARLSGATSNIWKAGSISNVCIKNITDEGATLSLLLWDAGSPEKECTPSAQGGSASWLEPAPWGSPQRLGAKSIPSVLAPPRAPSPPVSSFTAVASSEPPNIPPQVASCGHLPRSEWRTEFTPIQ